MSHGIASAWETVMLDVSGRRLEEENDPLETSPKGMCLES